MFHKRLFFAKKAMENIKEEFFSSKLLSTRDRSMLIFLLSNRGTKFRGELGITKVTINVRASSQRFQTSSLRESRSKKERHKTFFWGFWKSTAAEDVFWWPASNRDQEWCLKNRQKNRCLFIIIAKKCTTQLKEKMSLICEGHNKRHKLSKDELLEAQGCHLIFCREFNSFF